jgi:hypothetical protein
MAKKGPWLESSKFSQVRNYSPESIKQEAVISVSRGKGVVGGYELGS